MRLEAFLVIPHYTFTPVQQSHFKHGIHNAQSRVRSATACLRRRVGEIGVAIGCTYMAAPRVCIF